jgi:hypothetical protein
MFVKIQQYLNLFLEKPIDFIEVENLAGRV